MCMACGLFRNLKVTGPKQFLIRNSYFIVNFRAMNTTKTLTAGLVGAGHIGRFHTRHLSNHKNWTCAGILDIDQARASSVSEEFGVSVISDYDAMLQAVDAVFITSPTDSHFEYARRALEAGKHVFIEKPITNTLEEAQQLLKIARNGNLKIQVGHIERFNPALLALGELDLKPRFIEAHRLVSFVPRGMDNPVVHENMIHDIDIILSLVKSPVADIRANGVSVVSRHADMANARLTFENGCVANVTASRVSLGPMRKMRIFQPETYITIDFQAGTTEMYQLHAGEVPEGAERAIPLEGSDKQIIYRNLPREEQDAMYTEQAAFAWAIADDDVPIVSGEDGYEALRIAEQINAQLKENLN